MKRLALFLVLALVLSGCSPSLYLSGSSDALLGFIGVGPETGIDITSDVPFYGEVIVMGKMVGTINPGGTLSGTFFAPIDGAPVLVTILWFDAPARTHLIGMSWDRPYVRSRLNVPLHMELGNIRALAGNLSYDRYAYPLQFADTTRAPRMFFPCIDILSTTAVQLINCTLHDIRIKINGEVYATKQDDGTEVSVFGSGSVVYIQRSTVSYTYEANVLIEVLDHGILLGTQPERFTINLNSPQAHQFVVRDGSYRRY
jgi:hypothetical protein